MRAEKKLLDLTTRNLLVIFKEAVLIRCWQQIPDYEKLRRVRLFCFQGTMRQFWE